MTSTLTTMVSNAAPSTGRPSPAPTGACGKVPEDPGETGRCREERAWGGVVLPGATSLATMYHDHVGRCQKIQAKRAIRERGSKYIAKACLRKVGINKQLK